METNELDLFAGILKAFGGRSVMCDNVRPTQGHIDFLTKHDRTMVILDDMGDGYLVDNTDEDIQKVFDHCNVICIFSVLDKHLRQFRHLLRDIDEESELP